MATGTKNDTAGSVVEKRGLSTADLASITSFDDALALVQDKLGGTVISSETLGDGFRLIENKDELIGRPCMFILWNFGVGDYGPFVSARVLVQLPNGSTDKVVINDGSSTGIYGQLHDVSTRTPDVKSLVAPRGLRKSEYVTQVPNQKTGELEDKPATTYYIDTSAAKR